MTDVQEAFYELAPHILNAEPSEDGVIEFAERRFVFFHTSMFANLFEKMESVAGPVIGRKIHSFGEKAGKNIATKMDAKFEDVSIREILTILKDSGFNVSSVKELGKTSNIDQIHKILGYGRYVGWIGPVTIEKYEEGNIIRFKATNTFESDSYGNTGQKECDFIEGVTKGIMEYFWNTNTIESQETQCRSEGADTCVFEVVANES